VRCDPLSRHAGRPAATAAALPHTKALQQSLLLLQGKRARGFPGLPAPAEDVVTFAAG
jgi:hypothetical protein